MKIFNHYWWDRVWYEQISSRLRPRNKWLMKLIPRTWCDKDHLLEIVVLGSLKHYCDTEGEDCFNVLCCDNPPSQAEFMSEVKRNYELATKKLVALEKELEEEWKTVPHRDWKDINDSVPGDYERIYGKIDKLDKEIYDLKTEIMTWVIKNRDGLWT